MLRTEDRLVSLAQRVLYDGLTVAILERQLMSHAHRIGKPQEEELPADFLELGRVLEGLPLSEREKIEPMFTRVLESTRRRRRILTLVQDALSQLRLDMKYLMFDLEATRRERDEYRRKLEEA